WYAQAFNSLVRAYAPSPNRCLSQSQRLRVASPANILSSYRPRRAALARPPLSSFSSFNPRLRARGDGPVRRRPGPADCFDPRLRAGGDLPFVLHVIAVDNGFRSTPPRGRRRLRGERPRAVRRVSIHAS